MDSGHVTPSRKRVAESVENRGEGVPKAKRAAGDDREQPDGETVRATVAALYSHYLQLLDAKPGSGDDGFAALLTAVQGDAG